MSDATTTIDVIQLLMALGLLQPEGGDRDATDGADYYGALSSTDSYSANWGWFSDAQGAFGAVKFRLWLLEQIWSNSPLYQSSQLQALPAPPDVVIDLMASLLQPGDDTQFGDEDVQKAVKDYLTPGGDIEGARGLEQHLSVCLSAVPGDDTGSAMTLGLGLRKILRGDQVPNSTSLSGSALELHLEALLPLGTWNPDGSVSALSDPDAQLQLAARLVRADSSPLNPQEGGLNGLQAIITLPWQSTGEGLGLGFGDPSVLIQVSEPEETKLSWSDAVLGEEQEWVEALQQIVGGLTDAESHQADYPGALQLMSGFVQPVGAAWKDIATKDDLSTAFSELKAAFKKSAEAMGSAGEGEESEPELDDAPATLRETLHGLGISKQENGPDNDIDESQCDDGVAYPLAPWYKLKQLDALDVLNELLTQLDGTPLFGFSLSKVALDDAAAGDAPTSGPLNPQVFAMLASVAVAEQTWYGLRAQVTDVPLPPFTNTQLVLQLGQWLSGESNGENWLSRLLGEDTGAPGLGGFPVLIDSSDDTDTLELGALVQLVSVGLDWRPLTQSGVLNLSDGALQVDEAQLRLAILLELVPELSFRFAMGAKLKGVHVNLGPSGGEGGATQNPKDTLADAATDATDGDIEMEEINPYAGVAELFSEDDDGEVTQPEGADTAEETSKKQAEWKRGFGISAGYLVGTDVDPRWDVQLYDANGAAGSAAYMIINRSLGPVTLDGVGVLCTGAGSEDSDPTLGFELTGSMELGPLKAEVEGAGISFQVSQLGTMRQDDMSGWLAQYLNLDGLSVSVSEGGVTVAGGLLLSSGTGSEDDDWALAGLLNVTTPAFSAGAMGAYEKDGDDPASFFVYLYLSAKEGLGPPAFQINGLSAGFGYNRSVKVPAISEVEDFPLVKLVVGGEDGQDLDPMKILEDMSPELPSAPGQYFAALGLKARIAELIDAFLLAIVQWGAAMDVTLLGMGSATLPPGSVEPSKAEAEGKPPAIANLGVEIEVEVKPAEHSFMLFAEVTKESWVFAPSVKLSGGLALCIWGPQSEYGGDFVFTLGGYAPFYTPPAHYPVVPRLGLSWTVNDTLSLSGGLYFAITPACMMAGGSFSASYVGSRVSAWFSLYWDVLVGWDPFHYMLDLGVDLRIRVNLLVKIDVSASAKFTIQGQPLSGNGEVTVAGVHVAIAFGDPPVAPPPLSWADFAGKYIDSAAHAGAWDPAPVDRAPSVIRMALSAGQASLAMQPQDMSSVDPSVLLARADALVLSVQSAAPAAQAGFSSLASDAELPALGDGQVDAVLSTPLTLSAGDSGAALGVVPMNLPSLPSTLTVTLLVDEGEGYVPVQGLDAWTVSAESGGVAAALWSTGAPTDNDDALIPDAITSLTLSPPPASLGGAPIALSAAALDALEALDARSVSTPSGSESAPSPAPDNSYTPDHDALAEMADELLTLGLGLPKGAGRVAAFRAPRRLRVLLDTPLQAS